MAEQIDDDLWQQEAPAWCLMEEAHHGDWGNVLEKVLSDSGVAQDMTKGCKRCGLCDMDIGYGPGLIIGERLFFRMKPRSEACPSNLNTVTARVKPNQISKIYQKFSRFAGLSGFIKRGR